jgi:serine/threonine protein kinase
VVLVNVSDESLGLILILGHKHLYYNGVLHRDVSPGNILIEWRPDCEAGEPSNSGRLIDLDRGKKGKLRQSLRLLTMTLMPSKLYSRGGEWRPTSLVFQGPVRSGYRAPAPLTETETGLFQFKICKRPDRT